MSYPTYRLPAATVQEDFAVVPSAVLQEAFSCIVGPNRKVAQEGISAASDLAYGSYDRLAGNTLSLKGLPSGSGADAGSVKVTLTDVAARVADIEFASGPGVGEAVIGSVSALNKVTLDYHAVDTVGTNGVSASHGFADSTPDTVTYPRLPSLGNRDIRTGDTVVLTTLGDYVHTSKVLGLEPIYSNRIAELGGAAGGNDSANPGISNVGTSVPVVASTVFTTIRKTGTFAGTISGSSPITANPRTGVIADTYILESTSYGIVDDNQLWFTYTSLSGESGVATNSDYLSYSVFKLGDNGPTVMLTPGGTIEPGDQFRIECKTAWTAATASVEAAGASSAWTKDISYEIRVIRGGILADGPCRVAISAVGGTDRGTQVDVVNGTYFNVGSYGLRAKFGTGNILRTGDIFHVEAIAQKAGPLGVLRLRTPLPPAEAGMEIASITVLSQVADTVLPEYGYPDPGTTAWTLSDDGLAVALESGIEINDPTNLDDYGDILPVPVQAANVKIEWTSIIRTAANTLGSVTSIDAIETILGPPVPQNELAFGVLKSFENSNGQAVYYVPTLGTTLNDWELALKALESSDAVYFITPTTLDLSVLDLYKAHVLEMSGVNRGFERTLVGCRAATFTEAVVPTTTGYIANNGSGAFTLVHIPGESLIDTVRAGDTVRTSYSTDAGGNETYDSYTVADVTSDENLILVSGPSAAVGTSGSPRRMEVWRDLTPDEAAAKFADQANHFAHRRVTNIWPDNAQLDDGTSVQGWAMAAAYAGLCSSVVPHQGVTNVVITGFNKVPDIFRFNRTQLDTIAAGGNCIIVQDTKNGACYVRHQLTTDRTDVNMEEFSITRNLDSIAKFIRGFLRPFVGQWNIHEDFLGMIETLARQRFDYLEKTTATLKAGPQITGYGPEVNVKQDPLIRTRVTLYVPVSLPYPANNLDMTIVVI